MVDEVTTSPFPGMDPWLERFWGDVHHRLVGYACDQLELLLPAGLLAHVEERIYVQVDEDVSQPRIPDVLIVEPSPPRGGPPVAAASGVAVAEPLRIRVRSEPVTEGFIEIIDPRSGDRVITVIEVLSPNNKKPGEGRRIYRDKQLEPRRSRVNLVEVDLLGGGERVTGVPPELPSPEYRTPYKACVRRAGDANLFEVYCIGLRQRLPAIRVPLRDGDPDLALDFQPLIEQTYRKGRYRWAIDYHSEPDPPLCEQDAAWADQLLRARGLR